MIFVDESHRYVPQSEPQSEGVAAWAFESPAYPPLGENEHAEGRIYKDDQDACLRMAKAFREAEKSRVRQEFPPEALKDWTWKKKDTFRIGLQDSSSNIDFSQKLTGRRYNETKSQRLLKQGPYASAVAEHQGPRRSMEDRSLAAQLTVHVGGQDETVTLWGVFDGHGGSGCAEFVKWAVCETLKGKLEKYNSERFSDAGILSALKMTPVHLDKNYAGIAGTTFTMAVEIQGRIYADNTGDSRIILQNGEGETVQLTEDAKPLSERYSKGILRRDGGVLCGRVGGRLAVARAIGDDHIEGLTARPKVTFVTTKDLAKNAYLVLASDGLWDAASSSNVGKAVKDMRRAGAKPEEMARALVDEAHDFASMDNITVIVVKLS
jgi:protein phosphatase 1L